MKLTYTSIALIIMTLQVVCAAPAQWEQRNTMVDGACSIHDTRVRLAALICSLLVRSGLQLRGTWPFNLNLLAELTRYWLLTRRAC